MFICFTTPGFLIKGATVLELGNWTNSMNLLLYCCFILMAMSMYMLCPQVFGTCEMPGAARVHEGLPCQGLAGVPQRRKAQPHPACRGPSYPFARQGFMHGCRGPCTYPWFSCRRCLCCSRNEDHLHGGLDGEARVSVFACGQGGVMMVS